MAHWRELLPEKQLFERQLRPEALKADLAALGQAVARCPDGEIEEACAVAAMHELPWVRQALLRALAVRAPQHDEVRAAVGWLTHDYEDFVAFEAVTLAGELRLREVLADLLVIVGRASERVTGFAGKPVGIGHAVVLRAITAIIGSTDQAVLRSVEDELFAEGVDQAEYPARPVEDAADGGSHEHGSMAAVPGGVVLGGPPPAFAGENLLFDWNDPPEERHCAGFRIDKLPVSNAEYDLFAGSPAALRHRFCHPREPKGKLHLRNTLLDSRSGPGHPVTGVDWFDAYAYARSLGKRLPTETEWQRAGEGPDRRAYPWGDEFDGARTRCLPPPSGNGWATVDRWRDELLGLADDPPAHTARERGMPGNVSPFGVGDLSGNVWEWTSSCFDGPAFSPVGTDRDAIDVIYDQRSYVVIKGGTWTSLPEQASLAFRGRDLAFDRHFEIGFRCVCDCGGDGAR
ncbi:SUMF1/EgtB/PvdO family nonheme iron enzyme [Amycolatopsis halotolerans]|uniref:SUMF1/EgtB/PvdO family nonheme iron enzyme n=1 Tax=Amycolatopsis halotolerans TaxID=330083 RepID=A0ABV7QB92_9PSEU